MAKATKERGAQAEAPAVITPLHKRDRPATDDNMRAIAGKTAWRRLTPLQAIFARGQLAGGSNRYLAQDRYSAGQRYAEIFDLAQSSGRDSTQALNVSRSGGGASISQAQADAIKALVTVDGHMGARDRRIVRMVCGEGRWPSEAVRSVCGDDYTKAITPRFREALDSLIEAFERARTALGHMNMERSHG